MNLLRFFGRSMATTNWVMPTCVMAMRVIAILAMTNPGLSACGAGGHQEHLAGRDMDAPKAQVMGGRFLTLNTIVRVHQIEVTREIAHGPDESLVHTVAEARTFREAIEAAWPGARITWAFSWLALHDDRAQYRDLRELIVSYQKKHGDEITFIPGAYFSNMYNSREQVNRDLHEGLNRVSEIVGDGYRPKSIVAGFLAAENLRYLAEVEGIHVCQGNIWSQFAVDNGDGEGSICYPYYPSREHFCKPARGPADFIDCVNLDGWTVDFLAARIPGQRRVDGEPWRSRQGVGPIETVLDMGTERGTQSMLATTAAHFDDGFARNGFGWVTCGWEMGLVEARKIYGYGGRNGMEGLHLWLTETRKRWPDAQLITQGEFGLLWRAQFPNNDQLDYRFAHRGCGIRASQENLEIRWFMNREFRLALLRDWKANGPEQVIDFTRYDLPAEEPADPTANEPSRNWSLMNRINQKGSRPVDIPVSLSELTEAEQTIIRGHYPELFETANTTATSETDSAENWMHWRGPTADGRAGANAKPPIRWGQDSNVAWVAELPGEGSATPLVVGDQVFVLSAFKTNRKSPSTIVNDERAKTVPDELFYQFIVSSLDRHTGKTRWQKVVTEEVPHEGKHETNTYAAGSPVTDGKKLYFSFGSRGVFCYSLTGDLVWKADLGNMRTRNGWGEAVTPALTEDSVIVNWDQEEGSFIVALDKQTGAVRWKKDRPGEVTSWNTPLITTFDGQQQVVVNGTGSVKSYAASDGTLLWECGGQTVNAIPSPVRYRDSVVCMSGYRGSLAVMIPLDARGNVTESDTLGWKVTEGTPYVPSPIVSGTRLLFTAGNTNVLSCLDANTGELLLEKMRLSGLRSLYASPILANGHFYFTSREGTTLVVKDNENLDIVAVNELKDVIDASPVAVDDQLFLRSWTKLYCIQNTPVEESPAEGTTKPDPESVPLSFRQVDLEDTAETSANVGVGDINGDGHLDIVLAKGRHWPLHNRVFLNDGRGRFPTGIAFAKKMDRTYATALADVDLDGDLDILVSNDKPEEKVVFRNDGRGNFELGGAWGEPTWNTRNVTVGDLNGDRYPDLLVANRKSPSYIILNDGKGNFDRDHWRPIPSESATTLVAGDFNGDGFVDVVVPHRDGGVSRVWFNDGQLNFSSSSTFGPAKSATRACASGDLNGDGCLDLIMGDDRLGLLVCLNDGRGSFPAMLEVGDRALVPYAIAVGDMNHDQKLDLIVGYASGGSRVFLNDGTGSGFEEVPLGDGKGAVYGIAIGDVNSDGHSDIVQARSEGTNAIFINLGFFKDSE
jgi:outer membrane protein assembly factor BamB